MAPHLHEVLGLVGGPHGLDVLVAAHAGQALLLRPVAEALPLVLRALEELLGPCVLFCFSPSLHREINKRTAQKLV